MTERRPAKAPTIIDIAREAGVSKSLVSRALLGQSRISEESRLRIVEVAERLGYVKNAMAQGLVSQRTQTLGVLVRDAATPFYGNLHAALEERAAETGYRVVAATGAGTFELAEERRALQTLLSLRVEGLVVCSGLLPAEDIAPFIRHVPTVVAGRPELHPALGSVFCDEDDGAAQLVDHLTALGHRHVAVFLVPARLSLTQFARGTAMIRRLQEAGASVVVTELDGKPDGAGRMIGPLLEGISAGDGVTAVMCPSDEEQMRALEALDQAGVRVPEEVSVTGFDGVAPLNAPLLGLTTLRQPLREIGHRAVDLVLAQLDAPTDSVPHLALRGELVPGRTTTTPRHRAAT